MIAGETVASKQKALEEAMNQYGSFLLWYLNNLCADAMLAEDLYQELWVYVYQKYPICDFGHIGFLKRKAYQLYVDAMRKKGVRSFVTITDTLPEPPPQPQSEQPENSAEEQALYERFWDRFAPLNLSETEKRLFWLSAHYGCTLQEVCERMNLSKSTAHDWLKATKIKCLDYLNKESKL